MVRARDLKSPTFELVQLVDRLDRKRASGRSIQLSAAELDWLVLTGAYRAVVLAAEEEVYVAAKQRTLERGADPALVERLEARRFEKPERQSLSDERSEKPR